MQLAIPCQHYQQLECQSCQWLTLPYAQQVQRKQNHLAQQLTGLIQATTQCLPTVTSPQQGFRNKAKMVVSGVVERPKLGILKAIDDPQSAVDLTDCLLYPPHFQGIFLQLKDFIARAGLVPYNVKKQKGELKYILLTESRYNGELMLRFVVRSSRRLSLVQRELAGLMAKLPKLKVVSLNIQPQHSAVLEGEQEIFLTEQQSLLDQFNQIPLFIRPQGFFQTNPIVAEQLYATAAEWIKTLPIRHLWDLFCGVGGFGLHCAKALKQAQSEVSLTGIEISASAIACAKKSAQLLGLTQVNFQSLDSAEFALKQREQDLPDLIIVNPPRRGIGQSLIQFLNQIRPHFLLYSSCNAITMAQDLKQLTDYHLSKVQLFDMFPHSFHYEVLVLLERKNNPLV